MNENKDYISFIPSVTPTKAKSDGDLWFLFYSHKILVKVTGSTLKIPTWNETKHLVPGNISEHFLGELRGLPCYTAELSEVSDLPSDLKFMDLRTAGTAMEEEMFFLGGRASQVHFWDATHKFCGKCGTETKQVPNERAKACPKCGFTSYPRISPAIITAITKGDKILLAHNANFPEGFYSVIAGYVEPGETFEECVKREVLEEVGVQVKNIKYFSSQPWPFPNSLMIAFTAEYAGGDIKVDGVEINHADWFDINNLPSLPSKISVASKLIHWFIESQKI
jgi:NAD+ diphosphatase